MPILNLRGQNARHRNRLVANPSSRSGLIVSASIVGSGEIILTASLGAAVGFGMLWWVAVSCWSKSIVQAELTRYVVVSGDTYIRA